MSGFSELYGDAATCDADVTAGGCDLQKSSVMLDTNGRLVSREDDGLVVDAV